MDLSMLDGSIKKKIVNRHQRKEEKRIEYVQHSLILSSVLFFSYFKLWKKDVTLWMVGRCFFRSLSFYSPQHEAMQLLLFLPSYSLIKLYKRPVYNDWKIDDRRFNWPFFFVCCSCNNVCIFYHCFDNNNVIFKRTSTSTCFCFSFVQFQFQ